MPPRRPTTRPLWLAALCVGGLAVLAGCAATFTFTGTFVGRVYDASGRPVRGAWVELRELPARGGVDAIDFSGAPLRSFVTPAGGFYDLGPLGAGAWLLTVVASETPRAPEELARWADPAHDAERPADVGASRLLRAKGSERMSVDTSLAVPIHAPAEAAVLRGVVRGPFDPDRLVYQVGRSSWAGMERGSGGVFLGALVRADGSFEIGPLGGPQLSAPWVEAWDPAAGDLHVPDLVLVEHGGREGSPAPLADGTLRPRAPILLRFVDRAGEPQSVSWIEVRAPGVAGMPGFPLRVERRTDRFLLGGLPRGEYEVVVKLVDGGTLTRRLRLAPGMRAVRL